MCFERIVKTGNVKRALVLGIGGGGDVLATLPTANYLKWLGVEVLVGGTTWERIVVDPTPGPRSLSETLNIDLISETTALATDKTRTRSGIVFQACKVASLLNERVLLVDLNKGAKGLRSGLKTTIEKLKIDMVVGVDGGGDVLAKGSESGLSSPLADMICLAAIANLPCITVIGVYGFGSDGELRREEIVERLSEIASKGGYIGARGLTREDLETLKNASKVIVSEASILPVLAAEGRRGTMYIREGTRKVELDILSTITFYLDAKTLYESSPLARAISNTESLIEANKILNDLGLFTELDFELLANEMKTTSYREVIKHLKRKS